MNNLSNLPKVFMALERSKEDFIQDEFFQKYSFDEVDVNDIEETTQYAPDLTQLGEGDYIMLLGSKYLLKLQSK